MRPSRLVSCVCVYVSVRTSVSPHRFSEGSMDLSAEDVEEVCRIGTVDHDPVAVEQLPHCKVLFHGLMEDTQRHTDMLPLVPW